MNLGHKPLAIPFLKKTNGVTSWYSYWSAVNPTNPIDNMLIPNETVGLQSATGLEVDFNSSGFKVISNGDGLNLSSDDVIVGLAILEAPFKYSNAF